PLAVCPHLIPEYALASCRIGGGDSLDEARWNTGAAQAGGEHPFPPDSQAESAAQHVERQALSLATVRQLLANYRIDRAQHVGVRFLKLGRGIGFQELADENRPRG